MKNKLLLICSFLCLITAGAISFYFFQFTVDHVDIDDYPTTIDFGNMSDKQIEIFCEILSAVGDEFEEVEADEFNADDLHKILTHLGLYYGSMEGVNKLISTKGNTLVLNLEQFNSFEQQKLIIDARVDEAVSTFYKTSDRLLLWQITKYLTKRIDYTDGCRSTIGALNGEGVCSSYSILFYKMATRLGIKCHICYGYSNEEYHAWNKVELDGKEFYYDVTHFDSNYNLKYVHSDNQWGRSSNVNNVWAIDI